MENKSNKGLIITIIVLLIGLITLGGYVVYENFFVKEEKTVEKDSNETVKITNEDISGVYDFLSKEYCSDSDGFETCAQYSMKLTLHDDGTAYLISGNGQALSEDTKGTFSIKDDVITYERKFEGASVDGKVVYGNLFKHELTPSLNSSEKFKILDDSILSFEESSSTEYLVFPKVIVLTKN